MDYQFVGCEPRYYSQYMGESFWATNGDVKAFDVPPADGQWIPTDLSPTPAPAAQDDWFDTPTPSSEGAS